MLNFRFWPKNPPYVNFSKPGKKRLKRKYLFFVKAKEQEDNLKMKMLQFFPTRFSFESYLKWNCLPPLCTGVYLKAKTFLNALVWSEFETFLLPKESLAAKINLKKKKKKSV